MRVLLSKFLLNLAGWKLGPVGEDVPKCVVCVAPHTSNWDFIVGKLFYSALDRDAGFLIKKDWFFAAWSFSSCSNYSYHLFPSTKSIIKLKSGRYLF